MKAEDQVCTFDQARKLKELGVNISTLLSWEQSVKSKEKAESIQLVISDQTNAPESMLRYPAPTVAELGILLPWELSLEEEEVYIQGTIGNRQGEFYYIWFQSSIDNVEWELFPAIERDTEAQARAEALIWLIENDFVNASELSL